MRKYFPVLSVPKDRAVEGLRGIWHTFIPVAFGFGAAVFWQNGKLVHALILLALACVPYFMPVSPAFLYDGKQHKKK
jgi:hypothetical protein